MGTTPQASATIQRPTIDGGNVLTDRQRLAILLGECAEVVRELRCAAAGDRDSAAHRIAAELAEVTYWLTSREREQRAALERIERKARDDRANERTMLAEFDALAARAARIERELEIRGAHDKRA